MNQKIEIFKIEQNLIAIDRKAEIQEQDWFLYYAGRKNRIKQASPDDIKTIRRSHKSFYAKVIGSYSFKQGLPGITEKFVNRYIYISIKHKNKFQVFAETELCNYEYVDMSNGDVVGGSKTRLKIENQCLVLSILVNGDKISLTEDNEIEEVDESNWDMTCVKMIITKKLNSEQRNELYNWLTLSKDKI